MIVMRMQGCRKGVGARGAQDPQFLAHQLTLSQPGGAHSPHPLLRAPPDFQTLGRSWNVLWLSLKTQMNGDRNAPLIH